MNVRISRRGRFVTGIRLPRAEFEFVGILLTGINCWRFWLSTDTGSVQSVKRVCTALLYFWK